MNVLQSIGGFFELELPSGSCGFHPDAFALTNGRACMTWILNNEKPSRVYIPFYTCHALFEPMEKLGVDFEFYTIDDSLDPVELPEPGDNELLVLINYFGLKNNTAEFLTQHYGKRVVIDDSHRFFHHGYHHSYSFTTARKYFGVPDGAYLYGAGVETNLFERNRDISVSHNVKRLLGFQEEAFRDYQLYEASFGYEIQRVSSLSEQLLSLVDYEKAAQTRIENFSYLHQRLKTYNRLQIEPSQMDVPFCYPFLPERQVDKKLFYQHKIYIPCLWPDVLTRATDGFDLEKDITRRLLPLPVDQRYTHADMERIIKIVLQEVI